jgi:hypothetical protein
VTRGQDEAGPDGAEFALLLGWLLPGLPPDERMQLGRELAREASDTYAARGVPPVRWVLDYTDEGR